MIDRIEARMERLRGYRDRACRIADRVLPARPSAHGFYHRHDFIAAARRGGKRRYLVLMIEARLRAKAEGGAPHIGIPKNSDHLWGPGDTMFNASRDCADPAAWHRLRDAVAKEIACDRAAVLGDLT